MTHSTWNINIIRMTLETQIFNRFLKLFNNNIKKHINNMFVVLN